jgi:elongation factor P hydroxylase
MNTHLQRVVDTFETCLGKPYKTLLIGGFSEPEYVPQIDAEPAQIRFREDFLSSALHEIAHWCIAGSERRAQHDFGYWYWPEGRGAEQQLAFEQAEVRPQAIEWIFANACGQSFHLSRDNHGPAGQWSAFDLAGATSAMAIELIQTSLPNRADIFAEALALEFDLPHYKNPELYSREAL